MKRKPISRMRFLALLIGILIFAESFMFALPAAHAEATSSWSAATAYPIAAGQQACVTNFVGGVGSGWYVYCVGGETTGPITLGSYYASIGPSGVGPSWFATASASGPDVAFPSCTTYLTVIVCLGIGTGNIYFSGLSSSGITAWVQGTALPNPYFFVQYSSPNNDCVTYQLYLYCMANHAAHDGPYVFTTPVTITGVLGTWSNQGLVSGSNLNYVYLGGCTVVQTTGPTYLVCLGGELNGGGTNSNVYYAQIANGVVGTWNAGTSYPVTVGQTGQVACWSANIGYLNCLGTRSANAYYATMSSGGLLTWNLTTSPALATNSQYSCPFFVYQGLDYVFCTNGLNITTGIFSTNTFFANGAAGSASIFSATITNMDAGNYLIANNNKFYDFRATVTSNAIEGNVAQINNVTLWFNDSVHIITASYDNTTGNFALSAKSDPYAQLSPSSSAVSAYNGGNRQMVVDFYILLTANILDASNRDITLYALDANLQAHQAVVQENYFNIMNQGGGISILSHGGCSVPAGADTFQTQCHYGADAHNWIAENATYQNLEMYQAQFAVQLTNVTGGSQLGYFWQNYANSGAGTNPSSNKGDWVLQYGLYYYDNSTWVKGINVKLEMLQGRVGSSNLWTGLEALWYRGTTLIENDTIYNFVPATNLSQVNFWVNLWYSQNNASTSQGGQVAAYYTGMHKAGAFIWSSWSPFLGNQTQSQVFTPLKNRSGNTIPVNQAQFTKVFMNMSRPGAPLINAKQYNFQIETLGYTEQEFNVAASSAALNGIVTPTMTAAIVPTISSGSIFSPIINAIKSIATLFGKALLSLGNYVWALLGSRFPWFTQFWSQIGNWVVQILNLFGTVLVDVLGLLRFMISIISNILTPIRIIINAWGQIGAFFSFIPANQIGSWIQLFIIIVFGLDLIDAFARNDWPHIFALISTVYRVVEWILQWSWQLAKLLIDSIEGIIP